MIQFPLYFEQTTIPAKSDSFKWFNKKNIKASIFCTSCKLTTRDAQASIGFY